MQIMHLGAQILAAVLAHVHTHEYGRTHTYKHTHWELNEYVCPAEGKRTKMNSSLVLFYTLSLPVKAE